MSVQPPPLNDQVAGQDKQFSVGWKRWFNYLQGVLFAVNNYGVASYLQPTTGFTAQIPTNTGILLLDPAGTLAAGTVVFPSDPQDQQQVLVTTTSAITALTITANKTVRNPPSSLAAGQALQYYYSKLTQTWYNLSTGGSGGGGGGGGSGTVTSFSATGPLSGGIVPSVVNPTTTPGLTLSLAGNLLGVDTLSTTGFVRRLTGNVWSTTSTVSLTSQVSGVLPVANGGVPPATTNTWVLTLVAGVPVWQVASGGGGGSSKVTKSAVSLGTQAGSQSAFTYTTVPSTCARGFVSMFLVTASIAGQFDLVVRGTGADSGTLFLQAFAITNLTYLISLVFYYENDSAAQDFFIGWRNTGPNSASLTLTNLRVEKVA